VTILFRTDAIKGSASPTLALELHA
jgi:hypothetical protein